MLAGSLHDDALPVHSRDAAWRLALVEQVFRFCPPFVGGRVMAAALRATGLKLGKASAFWGLPSISGSGDVRSRLSIGDHCGFNFGCHFELEECITIEDHVSVGHQVMFLTRTYAGKRPEQRASGASSAPIHIGKGAWLGARCTVMPGVTIGAGSVIGASVVVHSDVAPNTLFTGTRRISIAKWR